MARAALVCFGDLFATVGPAMEKVPNFSTDKLMRFLFCVPFITIIMLGMPLPFVCANKVILVQQLAYLDSPFPFIMCMYFTHSS